DARKQVYKIITPKRETRIGSFPISIDFKEFANRAKSPVVVQSARQLREVLLNQQIALGVDRLDYSKGISEKLYAFRNALERFKDLRGKITLIQIVVPSREDISQYQSLKNEIEALISEINGRFSRLGCTPVHYLYRSLERTELLAYYRAADMALITSLKDGMNLVAKEYCAANVDKSGVLILSEFTGAAVQLREDSLLVNPYDIEGVADAIYKAYSMNNDERQRRMQRLRRSVARHDVFFVGGFLFKSWLCEKTDDSRGLGGDKAQGQEADSKNE
ncbi:MAG: trehalose-6-phosphate synthase, partial [Dehalococcoidia bacterium]